MPTLDKDIKRNSKFLSYYDGILNKEAEQLKQKEEKKREAKKTQRKNQTSIHEYIFRKKFLCFDCIL